MHYLIDICSWRYGQSFFWFLYDIRFEKCASVMNLDSSNHTRTYLQGLMVSHSSGIRAWLNFWHVVYKGILIFYSFLREVSCFFIGREVGRTEGAWLFLVIFFIAIDQWTYIFKTNTLFSFLRTYFENLLAKRERNISFNNFTYFRYPCPKWSFIYNIYHKIISPTFFNKMEL